MSAYVLQRVDQDIHSRLLEDEEFDETMIPPVEWDDAESGEGTALDLGEWNEAIHFILSDAFGEEQPIWDFLLVGYLDDEDLAGDDEDAVAEWFEELAACPVVSTLGPLELGRLHRALEGITAEDFKTRFDPEELEEAGVPPTGWGETAKDDLAAMVQAFTALKVFLARTVESNSALLGLLFLED